MLTRIFRIPTVSWRGVTALALLATACGNLLDLDDKVFDPAAALGPGGSGGQGGAGPGGAGQGGSGGTSSGASGQSGSGQGGALAGAGGEASGTGGSAGEAGQSGAGGEAGQSGAGGAGDAGGAGSGGSDAGSGGAGAGGGQSGISGQTGVAGSGGAAGQGGAAGAAGAAGQGGAGSSGTSGQSGSSAGGAAGQGGAGGSGTCSPLLLAYADEDGDGYGDPDKSQFGCEGPGKWVTNKGDCNDVNASVHPGQSSYFSAGYLRTGSPGGFSFDYDCDGEEESAPGLKAGDLTCPGFGSKCEDKGGVLPTSRSGKGVNPLCGSIEAVKCTGSGLACKASSIGISAVPCR